MIGIFTVLSMMLPVFGPVLAIKAYREYRENDLKEWKLYLNLRGGKDIFEKISFAFDKANLKGNPEEFMNNQELISKINDCSSEAQLKEILKRFKYLKLNTDIEWLFKNIEFIQIKGDLETTYSAIEFDGERVLVPNKDVPKLRYFNDLTSNHPDQIVKIVKHFLQKEGFSVDNLDLTNIKIKPGFGHYIDKEHNGKMGYILKVAYGEAPMVYMKATDDNGEEILLSMYGEDELEVL